jgi:S-adenosylmethionine/arginine decarboxylase-like enzyme
VGRNFVAVHICGMWFFEILSQFIYHILAMEMDHGIDSSFDIDWEDKGFEEEKDRATRFVERHLKGYIRNCKKALNDPVLIGNILDVICEYNGYDVVDKYWDISPVTDENDKSGGAVHAMYMIRKRGCDFGSMKSHIIMHTCPEKNYCSLDLFMVISEDMITYNGFSLFPIHQFVEGKSVYDIYLFALEVLEGDLLSSQGIVF